MPVYIVLGVCRSGTSLAAGILHLLGVPMGSRIEDPEEPGRYDFPDASEWNPTGHYEDAWIVNWCNQVHGWPPRKAVASIKDTGRLAGWSASRGAEASNIGWGAKCAGLIYSFQQLAETCDDLRLIITDRDLSRSVASFAARSRRSYIDSRDVLSEMWRELRTLDVSRHDVLRLSCDTQRNWCREIAEFVGCKETEAAVSLYDPQWSRF